MSGARLAPLLLGLGTATLALAIQRGEHQPFESARYGGAHLEGADFPKVLVSGGSRQTIPRRPRRVASLTVTADEILSRTTSPDRLAAVTHFADDPSIATCVGRVPSSVARIRGADPEGVIALEPDLVFVAHYTLESATRLLGAAHIPVVRLRDTHSFDDVEANVRLVASATGDEPTGEVLVREMRQRLEAVSTRLAGRRAPRVLYYSAVGYTSGTGTLIDRKIRAAGGSNVAAEAGLVGFKNVSLDLLIGLDPDVIVVPRWSPDGDGPVRELTRSPAWRSARAVQAGRVHALPASSLTSESPDSVRGVEELARILHPGAFTS